MAAGQRQARTGEKRGPGRPSKNASILSAAKRRKTLPLPPPPIHDDTPASIPSNTASPEPAESKLPRLPFRIIDNKPLPALPEPQSLALSSEEYQAVPASAVLAASLQRSRSKWTSHDLFTKYWVKPETGKNAKPPPADNPDVKWMKAKGECRIRLEPHVFTADIYVEERPKVAPPKQPPTNHQHYTPHTAPSLQQQPLSRPVQTSSTPGTPQPSLHLPNAISRASPSTTALLPQDKKTSPDPVIGMLASRASSNPALKLLMKEVATGYANPEQLRVFQEHIDELTEIIKKQKKDEEAQTASSAQRTGIGNSVTAGPMPSLPQPAQSQNQQIPPPKPYHAAQQPPPASYRPQQSAWPAPLPVRSPVILSFRDPGSTDDRFLFPQMSILEPLSPQHELVSFMVIKKGREAADPTGLEPDQDYWQPVTMMVEVAYGREDIIGCIRKWVKPREEVCKEMEEVMQRCHRAPLSHLAFRLPFKAYAQVESEEPSKEVTPIVEEKTKSKASFKLAKRLTGSGSNTPVSATSKKAGEVSNTDALQSDATPTAASSALALSESKDTTLLGGKEGGADTEENKPRRTLRKSVRIEG